MSKNGTIKTLVYIVVLLIILILIVAESLLLKSYLKVKSLEVVKDETQFINDFKPQGRVNIRLKECTDWSDLLYGWCVKSQFFPYKRLKIIKRVEGIAKGVIVRGKETNLSREEKWIAIDQFWKIFYIGYSKYPERLQYFGPYKLLK